MKLVKLLLLAATALSAGACVMPAEAAAPYTWQTVPWGGGGFVAGFAYHSKEKGLLYARTDIGGMYRYDVDGKKWIQLLDHLGHDDADLMGVVSMALDPRDPKKLYAACGLYINQWARKGALLRSNDQGRTWLKTELPIGVGGNQDGRGTGERLVVDPHNGDTLYFGSNRDGLWRSTDACASMSPLNGTVKAISLVAVDASKTAVLFVGSADDKPGLYTSVDGGTSLTRVEGLPAQVPQHLAFAPDGSVYVAFASGKVPASVNPSNASEGSVWKRSRDGRWKDISPDHAQSFGYSGVDIGPDGTVAVSTIDRWGPGDDIFISKDGGEHWIGLADKSKHDSSPYPWLMKYTRGEEHMGHWISDVKINPNNPDELVYGTGFGLWMTENLHAAGTGQPVAWDFADRDFEEVAVNQMTSPAGDATLLAAISDVAGAAWDDVTKGPSTGLFTPPSESNFSVDYGGIKTAFVVRKAAGDDILGYYSNTGGADWTPMTPAPQQFAEGKADWRRQTTIAASANGTSIVWGAENASGYYSTDKGKTWTASAGWPQGNDRPLQPVSDKAIDGVFYVYDRAGMAIDVSVDGGASFKPSVLGLSKLESWQGADLYVVPGRVRDLWLVAPFGVLHSAKAGEPMVAVKTIDTAWKIGFGAPAKTGGYPSIYLWGIVQGQEGLWRSDDQAKTWTRINDDNHQFGNIMAVAGDPIEYGKVYIAPGGRGILVGTAIK